MIRFVIVLVFFAAGIPWLVRFLASREAIPQVPSFLYETTAVVALFTLIIFTYLHRSAKPSMFVQLYLLSMAVKLVAYFAYVLIVVLEDPRGATANALYFLLVYTVFTVVEVAFLYRKIAHPSRR